MSDLFDKALRGTVRLFVMQMACLFLPAWTLDWWQAWLFLGVFYISIAAITAYLWRNDPKLLERRITEGPGSEKETSQKIIQYCSATTLMFLFIIPALDQRFGWSLLSATVVVVGDAVVAFGFLLVFLVFRENTFTSAIIEVEAGQQVISTGPYAVVRHPYYAASLVILAGVPIALGSWWGLLLIVPMALLVAWRLQDEEKYLAANLKGYADYRAKVKYRLVPLVW